MDKKRRVNWCKVRADKHQFCGYECAAEYVDEQKKCIAEPDMEGSFGTCEWAQRNGFLPGDDWPKCNNKEAQCGAYNRWLRQLSDAAKQEERNMLKDEKGILLNTEEAARQLGLTPKTLRRWHSEARGELIALQPGGPGATLYWRLADVQALATERRNKRRCTGRTKNDPGNGGGISKITAYKRANKGVQHCKKN